MIAASDLLAGFVRTVVYGLPLVGVTYAILRAIPGISPAARVVAWWLVSMRLALWLLPLPSLALPVLPASDAPAVQRAAGASSTVPIAVVHAARPAPARDTRLTPSRASALLAGWGLGVIGLGAVAFERTRRVRRLVREAKPADQEIIRRTHEIGGALGLRAVIDVRVSPATRTPQVSGLLRPVVLLPEARLARLEGEELDMALCHELVHVRQHDLWFGLLPAVTRCLLFFNPLAHLAAREYSLAREAACDARVLDVLGVAPRRYGRLLLSFAAVPARRVPGGAAATGSFRTLTRRLIMLESRTPAARLRRAGWAVPVGAAFALLPVSLVARPAAPAVHRWAAIPAGLAAPSPAVSPQHAAPAHGAEGARQTIHVRDDDRTAWVLFNEGEDSAHMNGSTSDVHAARAVRRGREAMLWVRRDGRQYVIRDAAAIARVRDAFGPVEALGRQQAEIGSRQAAIGAKMADVGRQQAEIGARQAAIGTKQAAIGAKQAAAAAELRGRDEAGREARQSDLESQMESLGKQMDSLGAEMEKLSRPMEDLSKQMEPLSSEQETLGAQMETLVEQATADLERIVNDAVANGTALQIK